MRCGFWARTALPGGCRGEPDAVGVNVFYSAMHQIIIHVDMDAFYASVEGWYYNCYRIGTGYRC